MRLTRPEHIRFTYHPLLAYRAALEWERRGFRGTPLRPEEIADLDPAWYDDLYLVLEWLGFHRDYHRRPDFMK